MNVYDLRTESIRLLTDTYDSYIISGEGKRTDSRIFYLVRGGLLFMATKRTNTRNGNFVIQCSQARKKCKWMAEIVPSSGGSINWDSPEAFFASSWVVKVC